MKINATVFARVTAPDLSLFKVNPNETLIHGEHLQLRLSTFSESMKVGVLTPQVEFVQRALEHC